MATQSILNREFMIICCLITFHHGLNVLNIFGFTDLFVLDVLNNFDFH